MWIKILINNQNEDDLKKHIIYLPASRAASLPSEIAVSFGQRKIKALVEPAPAQSTNQTSYSNPVLIYMTPQLYHDLLIQKSITYKLLLLSNECKIGPVIGLQLGDQYYYHHNNFMSQYTDAMYNYEKTGGLIIAFKECSIDETEKCIYGLYYNNEEKQWHYGKFPLPSAVFRRAYKTTQDLSDKFYERTGGKVFNSIKLTKWDVDIILKNHKDFQRYLPETVKFNDGFELKKFLNKHSEIILKPSDLSRARGICIIKVVSPDSLLLFDYSKKNELSKVIIHQNKLQEFLRAGGFLNGQYIAQYFIELAKINNAPWDIRVVMQKGRNKQWQCSGIECRVAGNEQLITNISRGGQPLSIKEAITRSFGDSNQSFFLKKKVLSLASEFCGIMDSTEGQFGEFGLDLAFDINQQLWFIEANTRPSFKGFKSMDLRNYYHLCSVPIGYATTLAGF